MSLIKFIFFLTLLVNVSKSEAKVTYETVQSGTLINFHLDNVEDSLQFKKNNEGFMALTIDGVSNQRVDGRAELPMLNILLVENEKNGIEKINVKFSDQVFQKKGKLTYFKGEKCRCKRVDDKKIDQLNYFTADKYWIEDFGDYRGKKIYRLNVLLGSQMSESFEIHESVKVFIPSNFSQLQDISISGNKPFKTLILTTSLFQEQIKDYVKSLMNKERQVFVNVIPGNESKENIKELIKRYYQQEDINHVILAGNDRVLSTYYVETKFDSQTPSDYPYSLMGGESDAIGDVFISRIPVLNNKEMQIVLEKWKLLSNGISIRSALGVSSNEGSNPSDFEYMRDIINPIADAKNSARKFLDQNSEDSNRDVFNKYLKKGVDWISYIGHGSGFSWPSFNVEYDIEDLENVDNQKRFPVIIDIACQNGRFSGEGRVGENFILGGNDRRMIGASLYYGGSVDISWHPPAIMTVGISDFISKNKNITISEALIYGHLYLINSNASKEDILDNLEWYHLQGDPGIKIL